jgi:hypothetical protein
MPFCIRELDDLVFDRRAVAGTSAADRSTIERRLPQMLRDDLPEPIAGMGQVAGKLLRMTRAMLKGEPEW